MSQAAVMPRFRSAASFTLKLPGIEIFMRNGFMIATSINHDAIMYHMIHLCVQQCSLLRSPLEADKIRPRGEERNRTPPGHD